MDDQRELAIATVLQLEGLASPFPEFSPGKKAIASAIRTIRINYVFGSSQRKRMILISVDRGHTTIQDLIAYTGLHRKEVDRIIAELLAADYLLESRQSIHGRGRPARSFVLSDRGKGLFSQKK